MISKKLSLFTALITTLLCCSCAPRQAVSIAPKGLALAGQRTVCGAGPLHRTFAITAVRAQVQLGQNLRTETWTYGGTLPGPVIEACEGDTVTIRMSNNDTDPAMGTDHGFDSHAFQMDTMRFAAVAPGETLELTGEVSVPGVFTSAATPGTLSTMCKPGAYLREEEPHLSSRRPKGNPCLWTTIICVSWRTAWKSSLMLSRPASYAACYHI